MTALFVILLLVVIYFVYTNILVPTQKQIIGDNSVGFQAKGSISVSDDNTSYEEV